MKELIAKFVAWLDRREDDRRLNRMAAYWARQGVVSPYAAAEEERWLRLKLEQFRTYACKRFLEDETVSRDDIKDEWLQEHVKPLAKIDAGAAKCLKAAIVAMKEEMFFGEAKKKRALYHKRKIDEATGQSPSIKQEMRETALKL